MIWGNKFYNTTTATRYKSVIITCTYCFYAHPMTNKLRCQLQRNNPKVIG